MNLCRKVPAQKALSILYIDRSLLHLDLVVDDFDFIIGSLHLLNPRLHSFDSLMSLPSLLDKPRLFWEQLLNLIVFVFDVYKFLVAFISLNNHFLLLLFNDCSELHHFACLIVHSLLINLFLHLVELNLLCKLLDMPLLLIRFVLLLVSFLPDVFQILRVLDDLVSWLRFLGFHLKLGCLLLFNILKFDKHTWEDVRQRAWVFFLNALVDVILSQLKGAVWVIHQLNSISVFSEFEILEHLDCDVPFHLLQILFLVQ